MFGYCFQLRLDTLRVYFTALSFAMISEPTYYIENIDNIIKTISLSFSAYMNANMNNAHISYYKVFLYVITEIASVHHDFK